MAAKGDPHCARSGAGASFALIEPVGRERVRMPATAPLLLEYEGVLKRPGPLAPTVEQRLAVLRHLFDWMVTGQIVPVNPAGSACRDVPISAT